MSTDKYPERTRQDHCTPKALVDVFEGFLPIALDPCWNQWSHVRPNAAFDIREGNDGLSLSWLEYIQFGQVYINPPYRNILPWVQKAAETAAERYYAHITMLIPVSPETKWSREARKSIDAVCEWGKRIAFEGAGGLGAKQASQLLYWGPRRYRFCDYFEQYGEVRAFDRRAV